VEPCEFNHPLRSPNAGAQPEGSIVAPAMNNRFQLFRDWPIRRKLIVNSIVSSGLALLLAGAAVIALEINGYRADVAHELNSIAAMIATNSSAALIFGDQKSALKTLEALRFERTIATAAVIKRDGSVMATWTRPGFSGPGFRNTPGPDGYHFEGSHLILYRTVTFQGDPIGTICVRSDMPELPEHLRSYGLAIAFVMAAASLLALIVGTLLQRGITRPLRHLGEIAREVSENNNYSVRAEKESGDELGRLVDAFNRMLEQVQSRDRHLEEQVEFRTAELTRANHELTGARDRAEEGARLKSEFLANMSHEIRTPMNVIIGMTQITLETALEPRQHGYLTMVRNSAESLLKIINDILDFSKIEAGKLELEPVDFSLVVQLNETTAAFVPQAQQKGIDLRLRIAPGVPERIHGDPARLRQIIVNLVGNAIKFTSKGVIELAVAPTAVHTDSTELHFTVSDTGIGIAPAKQKVIFDAFTQADGSTTRKYGGTGLGLSISRQLVQLMGGKIWVESDIGRGSRFRFTARFGIPAAANVVDAPAETETNQIRAIVIGQDPDYRTRITRMLVAWKIETAVVDDVASGIEVVKWSCRLNRPFSLMIADLDSALACSAALSALRDDPQTTAIPVILAGSREATAAELSRVKAVAGIVWPSSQSALLDVTMNVLRSAGGHAAIKDALKDANQEAGLIAANNTASPSAKSARPAGSSLRILVADDVRENRLLVAALCEKRGHLLTFAGNGLEAVEAFRNGEFDLILMDIQMPEMGGTEATAEIRRLESARGSRTPVIALTAHAMKGDREKYISSGMDGYVSKPIQRDLLFQEIAAVTRGRPVAA